MNKTRMTNVADDDDEEDVHDEHVDRVFDVILFTHGDILLSIER